MFQEQDDSKSGLLADHNQQRGTTPLQRERMIERKSSFESAESWDLFGKWKSWKSTGLIF